jgi:predicted nucleotide-binding protein
MANRRIPQPPQLVAKKLSLSDIDLGVKKLSKRIDEVTQLDAEALADGDPSREKVQRSVRDTVADIFGENSREAQDFSNPQLLQGQFYGRGYGDPEPDYTENYIAGIKKMQVDLQGLIDKLEEQKEEIGDNLLVTPSLMPTVEKALTRDVFIVHGHDEAAKLQVARFLERLDLKPIILHEQANYGSSTIIEKLERHSGVAFAVVLLTPDDMGAAKDNPQALKPRARQNVILELGYFLAKLGRNKVCPLYKEGVELPSDFSGVTYTLLDHHDGWQLKLARELKIIWSDIDLNMI